MFVFAGMFSFVASIVMGCNEVRYRTSSRETDAHVTYAWTTASKSGGSPHCYYDFVVDGKTYSGKGGSHFPGEEIRIQYLPSSPETNREVSTGSGLSALVGIPVGVLLVLAGGHQLKKNDDLLSG